jgi:tetratricopeptide (TPR) repeat protein
MSLINKILKELDQNEKKPNIDQIPLNINFDNVPQKKNLNFKILVILGMLIIFFSSILLFSYLPKSHNKQLNTQHQKTLPIPPPKLVTKPQAQAASPIITAEPAIKLDDVTINVDNNKTTVDFVLSQNTYYYVSHGKTLSQLIITLGNTSMLKDIPVKLENTAIKSLTFDRLKDSVNVNIELLPSTQIMELQLYDQPRNQLQLVLFNNRTPLGKVTKTEATLTPEQQTEVRFQKSLDLIAQHKNSQAITELQSVIKSQPDNFKAYESLINLYINNNQLNQASELLDIAINKFPVNFTLIQTQAGILAQKGNLAKALSLLLNYSPDVNTNPDYYALIASIYEQQNKNSEAAEIYERLLGLFPNRAIWWVGLGISLEATNQKYAAQEAYQRAYNLGNLPADVMTFVVTKIQK